MKAAIISLGSESSKMAIKAMKKYFKVVDDLDIRKIEINMGEKENPVLYDGEPVGKYDCIYAKGSFRYNPLLRSLTAFLHKKAYMPLVPTAFTLGHDKLLTQLKLEQEDIPMPKTYLSSSTAAAKKILEKVNYPIIMKFPEGTQGKGVMFADSFASANSMLDALIALKQPFLIQEYIETEGVDIRAIVVGEKVVASMKRKAIKGDKRANIHAGGIGEPIELDAYSKKIAVKATKAIGAEICAVDIIESAKGPLVIEVNLSPGLEGITRITKVNIADKIAKFLYEKAKSFSDSETVNGTKKIMEDVGIKNADAEKIKEVITELDFRGNRILLPEMVTNVTKFKEKEEFIMKLDKGKLIISDEGKKK